MIKKTFLPGLTHVSFLIGLKLLLNLMIINRIIYYSIKDNLNVIFKIDF